MEQNQILQLPVHRNCAVAAAIQRYPPDGLAGAEVRTGAAAVESARRDYCFVAVAAVA